MSTGVWDSQLWLKCRITLARAFAVSILSTVPLIAHSGPCDTVWIGEKIISAIAGRPAHLPVPLRDKQQRVHEVTVDQIQAFSEAKERITRAAGLSPSFIICDSAAPNAFATTSENREVVGVTIGMLRMVDGDRDMAAAVLGHELAHHTKRHRESATNRDLFLGLAGIILGAVVDARTQSRTGVATGLGVNLGQIGAALISRKFDRDQEREADETGFQYLVAAGFNPLGAVRLAERLNQLGGGVGLFFDSHPGWSERNERFRTMIAESTLAQQLVARSASAAVEPKATVAQAPAPDAIVLDANFTISDAQKSYEQALAALRAKDTVTALREMRVAAAGGFAPAQIIVGSLYARGLAGLPKDDAEAVRLFRLASDQDDPVGQASLGFMYVAGRGGLVKDEVEAIRLFRLSAEQGHPLGQVNLGSVYDSGKGNLAKDEVEAARLYRLAADQGHALGQANLGYYYASGKGGITQDEAEAARLFRLAADQRNALGQANLGFMYSTGKGGLGKDDIEAARLYRLAANQGNALGQNNLGVMYENGRGGLSKSIADAISWYQKAATQGNSLAVSNLKRLGRM